jgi:hypothetical protein
MLNAVKEQTKINWGDFTEIKISQSSKTLKKMFYYGRSKDNIDFFRTG